MGERGKGERGSKEREGIRRESEVLLAMEATVMVVKGRGEVLIKEKLLKKDRL